MTEPENIQPESPPPETLQSGSAVSTQQETDASRRPPKRQGTGRILLRSLKLYNIYWRQFTQVLLWPVFQIYAGFYACQLLTLALPDWFNTCCQPFASQNLWFPISVMILIALGGIAVVFRGGWQYAVYWATLNINAWEASEGQFIDFRMAYSQFLLHKQSAYTMLACTYFSLPVIALLPAIVMTALGMIIGPNMLELLMFAGLLQSFVLLTLWACSLVGLTYVFQIAAFENGIPLNPGPTFMLSMKLALKRFWTTLNLQVLLYCITNCIFPTAIVAICRFLHIVQPLDGLHRWILDQITADAPSLQDRIPLLAFIIPPGLEFNTQLAHIMTDLSLGILITLLMLPLGTFAFTLLYKDILKCDRSTKTMLGI